MPFDVGERVALEEAGLLRLLPFPSLSLTPPQLGSHRENLSGPALLSGPNEGNLANWTKVVLPKVQSLETCGFLNRKQ